MNKIPYCPYCQSMMDIESKVVSKEMLLKSSRYRCVTKASCMKCMIEVVITENIAEDDLFIGEKEAVLNKKDLYVEILKDIPLSNKAAFLTARKSEVENKIENLPQNALNEREELVELLDYINSELQNMPWNGSSA